MKFSRLAFASILSALLLACVAPLCISAQPKASMAAPTGTYFCDERIWRDLPFVASNSIPLFTLWLETNGTYVAESAEPRHSQRIEGGGDAVYPNVVKGTWKWDAQTLEFRLEPGDFTFFIKCLPVDKQHTNRLVWGTSWLVKKESK